jgi:hypothetical protein
VLLATDTALPAVTQGVLLATDTSAPAVVGPLLAALVFSIATFFLAGRVDDRHVGSVGLLAALSAGFGLYAALAPTGNDVVAVALFVGIFAFLRLLSRFESVRR